MQRRKIQSIVFTLSLSFLSSYRVAYRGKTPLPPTLGQRPTRDWLQRLYVRFDFQDDNGQPIFEVDPWLKALAEQGAQVIAYRINAQDSSADDPFIKTFSPTSILDVSWHLFPVEVQHQETERKETDTQGKEHVVKESNDSYSQNGELKVALTSAKPNLALAHDRWLLSEQTGRGLERLAQKALKRWVTPKNSPVLEGGAFRHESAPWFATRIAVLPFSDEVNSVEAPVMIRRLVFERLRQGGYALVPLEEVDIALRRHGFSQRGQLKNINPQQLAEWLSVSRLLYGHLDTFDNISLGIAGRRAVGGDLSL